jgi:hypothetical protein
MIFSFFGLAIEGVLHFFGSITSRPHNKENAHKQAPVW